ncbi:Fur family transcriptional regulator [Desulfocurvus sp. DL9XJH121]
MHDSETSARRRDPPLDSFMDWLIRNNLRLTPQRKLILEVFLDAGGHLTPEELFIKVRGICPSIGIATVYRNVKLLARSGLARELRFDDGLMRYAPRPDDHHHDHIICTRCGRRLGVREPEIQHLQDELAARHDFVLTGRRLFLYGLCEECRKKGGGRS